MALIIAGASAYSGYSNNRVAWPYIISAVNCNGSEAQLLDCIHSTHFAECGQAEAACVHCQPGRYIVPEYYAVRSQGVWWVQHTHTTVIASNTLRALPFYFTWQGESLVVL